MAERFVFFQVFDSFGNDHNNISNDEYFSMKPEEKSIEMCVYSLRHESEQNISGNECAQCALVFVDVTRFSNECRHENFHVMQRGKKVQTIFFHPILKPEMVACDVRLHKSQLNAPPFRNLTVLSIQIK